MMSINIKKRKLSLLYQNVQGLNTKLKSFKLNISASNYDIIVLTETWLTPSVFDQEMFDNRYVVYRKDRNLDSTKKETGGGVLVAVKSIFNCHLLPVYCSNVNIEEVRIKINLIYTDLYICAVYIPPSMPLECYTCFYDSFENNHLLNINTNILVLGDFNMPRIVDLNNISNKSNIEIIYQQFLSLYNFQQFNNILNERNRCLDLVLYNNKLELEKSDFSLVNENRDHPTLFCSLEFLCNYDHSKSKTFNAQYNYKKADFLKMYNMFKNIDWSNMYGLENVNHVIKLFYDQIYAVLDECVPLAQPLKRIYPPWFNKRIILDIKKKDYFRKKFKKTGSHFDRQKFMYLRIKVKNDIKMEQDNYINNIENNIDKNPVDFWKYIKTIKNNAGQSSASMIYEGAQISENDKIAESFAKYFKSVYTDNEATYDVGFDTNTNVNVLDIQSITEKDILEAIKKLKPKKSVGPDNIPPYIFKGCAELLLEPLKIIFNLIIKTRTYPDLWKQTKICPIFKSGNTNEIVNHRPVALICAPSKILESILYVKIYSHVKIYISDKQHGFMTNKSPVTNLMCFSHSVNNAVDDNGQVDVIFTDFAKAFDKVDHDILLRKLDGFGFSNSLLQICISYLKDRKQYVVYKGARSTEFSQLSGVPQGSNLGPLFFLCMINDIPEVVQHSNCQLFADDFKIYKRIDTPLDSYLLQSDLNNIYGWSRKNSLSFNIKKCFSMTFSRKVNNIQSEYYMNGKLLPIKNNVKDLGVMFDSQLTFNLHINNMVLRAFRILGFIIRNSCNFKKDVTLIRLYNVYVRSLLEYASLIWSPLYETYKNVVEKVQKRFLRYLYYKKYNVYYFDIPYTFLLSEFNFKKLECRRSIASALFVHKLFNGKINCIFLLEQFKFSIPQYYNRNTSLLFVSKPRTNLGKNGPIYRLSKIVNSLGNTDIFFDSFSTFKKQTEIRLST